LAMMPTIRPMMITHSQCIYECPSVDVMVSEFPGV
jgi:hypothetical protein